MYVSKERLIILLSLAETVISSPTYKKSAPKCIGNAILSLLHNPNLSASATKFCSSYISIKPVITTVSSKQTVTPATVTVTSTTATVIVTTTVANPVVQTVYTGTTDVYAATTTLPESVITETSLTTTTTTATVAVVKRDLQERGIPVWLVAFAAKEVSSACSCLSIPAATSITTISTTYTASTPTATFGTDTISSVVIGTVVSSEEASSLITSTLPAQTTTTTIIAVATSTSKVIPSQCSNLSASPVKYQSVGLLAYAGVGGTNTISAATSPEECCSYCYTNSLCFGFAYGNYDPAYINFNDPEQAPPITSSPQCYNYDFANGGCVYNYVAFGPLDASGPTGGSTSFGYGDCSVSPW